jgi:hypothetical protein
MGRFFESTPGMIVLQCLAVGAAVFSLLGPLANRLRPSVEVAALGQTRLWRAIKFVWGAHRKKARKPRAGVRRGRL